MDSNRKMLFKEDLINIWLIFLIYFALTRLVLVNNLFTHPYDKFESSFEEMLHILDS